MQRKIDYSQVIEGYNECLRIDPDFVFALFNMANVYAKNGEIERAIETFNQVLRLDKDIAEAGTIVYLYRPKSFGKCRFE